MAAPCTYCGGTGSVRVVGHGSAAAFEARCPVCGRTDGRPAAHDRIVLVYQAGIANVFAVDVMSPRADGRNARRLLQADFVSCRWFAKGMLAAGCRVATAHCNQAGDITDAEWSCDLSDAPFRDQMVVVKGP